MAAAKLVKNLLVLFLCCSETVHIKGMRTNNEKEPDTPDAHIIYDQRQSGKYNIHVVIKDVAIIEMDQNEVSDQNYSDEDYYYDEDDLTVKPLIFGPTTTSAKPLDSTGDNQPTTLLMQTTRSSTESRNLVTTLKTTDEILNATLSSNITSHKEFNNSGGALMPFFTTQRPTVDIKPRSKIEPIYAFEEPVLQPRHNMRDFNYGVPVQTQSKDSTILPNSRIFKVKVHRSHRAPQLKLQRERCRTYQYRDARGNCRGKRSSSGSILNRLFKMLVTLPFKEDEQRMDE